MVGHGDVLTAMRAEVRQQLQEKNKKH
jgi:hypothetical protein